MDVAQGVGGIQNRVNIGARHYTGMFLEVIAGPQAVCGR
jgi:hypothetical protein